jgi:hypothetical protein
MPRHPEGAERQPWRPCWATSKAPRGGASRFSGRPAKNRDGNLVALPTLLEVCGNDEDNEGGECNREEEPRQLDYFKPIKNRIRVKENDTHWWWLSTTADAARFAVVSYNGYAYYGASGTTGGVAPAICIS